MPFHSSFALLLRFGGFSKLHNWSNRLPIGQKDNASHDKGSSSW